MVDFNFFWVGPPATEDYLGMDLIGPRLTKEKYHNHRVILWCLKAYQADYKAFSSKNDIELRVIEDYLDDIRENNITTSNALKSDALTLTNLITSKVARAENSAMSPQDCAREYVTIKALMQFFLQNFEDGYFLDSNIIPAFNAPNEPPVLEKFIAPIIPRRESFQSLDSWQLFFTCDLDPWLMYSPANDVGAKSRFESYFNKVYQAERRYIEEGLIDRAALSSAFVFAVKPEFFNEKGVVMGESLEATAHTKTRTTVEFLGFTKRYANSHKVVARERESLLFTACTEGCYNPREIEHYLQAGHSLTSPSKARTILQEVLLLQDKTRLVFLLSLLSPEEAVNLFSSKMSFLDYLCQGPSDSECLKILLRHYIEIAFDTLSSFIELVTKVRLILQQKANNNIFTNSDKAFDSIISSWLITAASARNGTLATALDIVTQLGPLTSHNTAEYFQKIRAAIDSPRLSTPGFFPPGSIKDSFIYSSLGIETPKHKRVKVASLPEL